MANIIYSRCIAMNSENFSFDVTAQDEQSLKEIAFANIIINKFDEANVSMIITKEMSSNEKDVLKEKMVMHVKERCENIKKSL